jgi:hypothetical protein
MLEIGMSEPESIDGVRYHSVEAGYFEKRGLRKYAGVWSLWALGVGAVISGDFFGWNFGLAAGGFGGLFIATLIVVVMYLGLCFSLAEMSPALPHTGGAYSFGRSAMGPWGGFLTGLGENMEYVLTPAVIVVGIGGYLGAIFETPAELAPMWWLICYVVFVGLKSTPGAMPWRAISSCRPCFAPLSGGRQAARHRPRRTPVRPVPVSASPAARSSRRQRIRCPERPEGR